MKRLGVLLMLFFVGACEGGGGTVSADPKLGAPESLEFGYVLVSSEVTRSLTLRNSGAGAATVRVEVTAPFAVEETELSVPGRSTRQLAFSFFAEEPGPQEGLATLEWQGGTIEVRLRAEAVEPQVCEPSDDCRTIVFEPGEGCVETRAPDGTPCEDPCLEDAVCMQGKCTGTRLDCSDGDPCTHDYCDAILGCQNVGDPERVCETDDPCKVASCDPEGGCLFEPALDGTPCGPATCGMSMVCISGQCSAQKTPEGGACGEATPCQPQGMCVNGECDQPPPGRLRLTWTDGPAPGWDLYFDGVGGPLGRIYWVECDRSACTLASAQPTGQGSTLRTPLFSEGSVSTRGRLLLSNGYLVSSYQRGVISIRRGDDLGQVARLELAKLLPAEAWEWEVVELAAHRDRGFALVEARIANEPVQGWAISFSIPGGEIDWTVEMNGIFEGLVVDEVGRLYFAWLHRDTTFGSAALVSLTRAGGERWRVPVDFNAPLAVASGRLLDGNAVVRRIEDGAVENSLPALIPLSSRSALLGFEEGVIVGYPLVSCGVNKLCPDWNPHLIGFDPWKEGIEWMTSLSSGERWDRTEPILTEGGSILLVQPLGQGNLSSPPCERTYVLEEIRMVDGRPQAGFRCELPGDEVDFHGPVGLYDGHMVVANHCSRRLEAYALGEEWELAERGWVTAGGSPSRNARPR